MTSGLLGGLALGDQVIEPIEEHIRIIRARAGFRVILYGEDRLILETQAGDGVIVHVHLRDDGAAALQVFALRSEAVILGGDGHAVFFGILDGLIAAAMRPDAPLEGD